MSTAHQPAIPSPPVWTRLRGSVQPVPSRRRGRAFAGLVGLLVVTSAGAALGAAATFGAVLALISGLRA